MKIIEVIGELFLLYLLYKLVFDLIIPVYQATKQVKTKMGEMQQKMNEQQRQQQQQQFTTQEQPKARVDSDDYIDYEEVK